MLYSMQMSGSDVDRTRDELIARLLEDVKALETREFIDQAETEWLALLDARPSLEEAAARRERREYLRMGLHSVKRGKRRERSTLPDGRSIDTQRLIGVGIDDPLNGYRYVQLPWEELDREQIKKRAVDARARADYGVDLARLWTERDRLMDMYPEVRLGREACALAGIDPEAFDASVLGQEAI